MIFACLLASVLSLDGSWEFRFEEGKSIEEVAVAEFSATGTMTVPGCYDMMPQWYMKRGTGLYRRTFTLEKPMKDAMLVVEGMGVRAKFSLDGRDLGLHPYPYARLEIPVGALGEGTHEMFAAVDNILQWPRVKLARPFYDFYFYGGFYHGVKLVERRPKVFVRTLDYRTGKIEIEVEGGKKEVRTVDGFKLWSPEAPNLMTIEVAGQKVRFGIRQIEAKNGKIYLNGKELFLKGFNRHESDALNGAATSESLMLQDIQRLKALGGNFIRGAHYQQCERFLDLCDENGVLVWEESLGWGNGAHGKSFPPDELADEEFCEMQIKTTRDMVRSSFNHPCIIIYGFLNECASGKKEAKALVDRLIETVRAENTGRLVTFACCYSNDISNENTDLIAINTYPGGIPPVPGTPAEIKETVRNVIEKKVSIFRKSYPEKPIIISESGCGGVPGMRGDYPSVNTEEFQAEYLECLFEAIWANKDLCGFAIWQMNDGRTRERFGGRAVSAMFGGSVAGVFDRMRKAKLSAETVRRYFEKK